MRNNKGSNSSKIRGLAWQGGSKEFGLAVDRDTDWTFEISVFCRMFGLVSFLIDSRVYLFIFRFFPEVRGLYCSERAAMNPNTGLREGGGRLEYVVTTCRDG